MPWRFWTDFCDDSERSVRSRTAVVDGGGAAALINSSNLRLIDQRNYYRDSSNPVAPTLLHRRPFDENIEGTSHCRD